MNILIVEDNLIIAEQLKQDIISIYGEYFDNIYIANNYDKAIYHLENFSISLAFLDIKIDEKGKTGIDVAEKIKSKIPFIFISGLPDVVGINKARNTLPIAYLRKPYLLNGLKDAIMLAEAHIRTSEEQVETMVIGTRQSTLWVNSARNVKEKIEFNKLITLTVSDHYLYARLVSKERPIMFLSSLAGFYEKYLKNNDDFFQLKNNTIINLKYMNKIMENKVYFDSLSDGLVIPRNKKEELLSKLNQNEI
ncbi:MAG: hypothetical protein AAFQ94_29245 [Bacteroidota bacterium]